MVVRIGFIKAFTELSLHEEERSTSLEIRALPISDEHQLILPNWGCGFREVAG